MKIFKFITFAFIFSVFVIACGNNENEENKETTEEQTEDVEKAVKEAFDKMREATDEGESLTCEEYLDNFEKWAEKYIALLKKVKQNPSDATIAMDYAKLAPELTTWANEWQSHVKCSQEDKYVKRYEEISDRIEKAADEIE
jgi:hypothetical protein